MSYKINILIVENEILLAQDIGLRLGKMGYNASHMVSNVLKAVEVMKNHSIDLVLIDILLDGSQDGIDLANIINEKYGLPFVFLTSHADKPFIERAKEVRPYAYMLKPFNDREVQIAIELALANYSNNTPETEKSSKIDFLEEENEVLQLKGSLFLKKNDHFQKVNLQNILWLEADSNYTEIHTEIDTYIYATVLKKVEEKLPKSTFLRVHRSYIVNIDNITGFVGNLLYIENKTIPVSKSHQAEVFRIFNTI